jgi:hypothetical protein
MTELIKIFNKYKKNFDISEEDEIINIKTSDTYFSNTKFINFYAVIKNETKSNILGEIHLGTVTFNTTENDIKYLYFNNSLNFPVLCKTDKRSYVIIKEIDDYIKKNFFIF